jgi:hypothetical protein
VGVTIDHPTLDAGHHANAQVVLTAVQATSPTITMFAPVHGSLSRLQRTGNGAGAEQHDGILGVREATTTPVNSLVQALYRVGSGTAIIDQTHINVER